MAALNNSDGCRPLQSIVLSCQQVPSTLQPSEFAGIHHRRTGRWRISLKNLTDPAGLLANETIGEDELVRILGPRTAPVDMPSLT
jgi:hypothetical protein